MADFHTLDDIEVRGKRVLLRADLNVPVKDGRVTDATRIERLAPTIRDLADKGARVIVMSHFGRPEKGPDPKLSLKPLVEPLAKAVGRPVAFAEDCVGASAQRVVGALKDGDVALLENTRFHPEEEMNDPGFAKALASLGDL
jgi:phosphoglycerate kinase